MVSRGTGARPVCLGTGRTDTGIFFPSLLTTLQSCSGQQPALQEAAECIPVLSGGAQGSGHMEGRPEAAFCSTSGPDFCSLKYIPGTLAPCDGCQG